MCVYYGGQVNEQLTTFRERQTSIVLDMSQFAAMADAMDKERGRGGEVCCGACV